MKTASVVVVVLLMCHFPNTVSILDLMSSKCGSTIYVNSSNVIRFDSSSLPQYCKTAIEAILAESEVHLRFLKFNVPCVDGEVTLSGYSSNNADKVSLCGINNPSKIYKSYLKTLTISYHKKRDNSSHTAHFNLLASKINTGYCGSLLYECTNGDCVDESVKCDGYNNCDDNSDEDAECEMDAGFISGIAIAAFGSFIFLAYLVVLVYRNIRHGALAKQRPPRVNLPTIDGTMFSKNFHSGSAIWCPPPSYFRSPGSLNNEVQPPLNDH